MLVKLVGVEYLVFIVKDKVGFCLWDIESILFNIINMFYMKDVF